MNLSKTKSLIPAPENGAAAVNYEIILSNIAIHLDENDSFVTPYILTAAFKTVGGVRSSCNAGTLDESGGIFQVQYMVDSSGDWSNCYFFNLRVGGRIRVVYGMRFNSSTVISSGVAFRIVYIINNETTVVYEMGEIPIVKDGPTGPQGPKGDPTFYYFDKDFDSTKTYKRNASQAPYVRLVVTENDITRKYYYMLVANTNLKDGNLVAPRTAEASGVWELMTSDFKYVITEVIFGEFAFVGGAIFTEGWMISQYGVLYDASGNATSIDSDSAYVDISGVRYDYDNAYTKFDSTSPNENKAGVINFVPNYSVNLKRGWSYQNVAEVNGVFKAKGSNGRSTYLGAAFLEFGYLNVDIFRIECEGTGASTNVRMTIGTGTSGTTFFDIESRGKILSTDPDTERTALIKLCNTEAGTNVPTIVIHKGGIAMIDVLHERIYKQKTWDELLS